jgi:Zn-dependent peptidase ImmA (M78 family)
MIRQPRNLQLCQTAMAFVPERLQLARELRQMSRNGLAGRLGIAAAAVAGYEDGHARPEAPLVARLSLTLGVPLAFFARHGRRPIGAETCHFRHLRPAQHVARRAQLALTELLTDVLEFAHAQVVLPAEGLNAWVGHGEPSFDEVQASALALRRRWGLGLEPIDDLTRVCELNGVVVHRIHDDNTTVHPFSLWHRGWPIILFVEHAQLQQQTRFDKAHELGHLVMHADVRAGHPRAESEADAFARALLLPAPAFISDCPTVLDWPRWYGLERKWRVSIPVLVQRGHELGRISEPVYRRALAVWKEGGAPHLEIAAPDWEHPSLVRRAFDVIADEWPLGAVARELGLLPIDLATVAGLRGVAS